MKYVRITVIGQFILGIIAISSILMSGQNKISTQLEAENKKNPSLFGSMGIVYMKEIPMDELGDYDTFVIKNLDGSQYMKVATSDCKLTIEGRKLILHDIWVMRGLLEYRYNFMPYEFYLPERLIAFECKSIHDEYYEIYTNRDSNITKILPKHKKLWAFSSWGNAIASGYISFSRDGNSLSTFPSSDPKYIIGGEIKPYFDTHFIADSIKGDWMHLKAVKKRCKKLTGKVETGWIRWKKDEFLLIRSYRNCDMEFLERGLHERIMRRFSREDDFIDRTGKVYKVEFENESEEVRPADKPGKP
ncbi:MAG: hypothetical protein LWX56_04170 [Ignavibacteria bacterium]|nr:hypothetical protein [Ignavibacteria bacterium]